MRSLDRDAGEYARLFDALSINVIQFFRDDSAFRLIRTKLLPTLLADKIAAHSQTFRVWSAGCATGQETYSLAILLAEALKRDPGGLIARVYGTDIDAQAVAFARCGVYEPSAMEGAASAYALRHFVCNGHFRVSPEIRQLVRFKVHDLTQDRPLRHLDLLLCRNVLIYFSKETQRRLLDTFDAALRPGGFLVLGKTEAIGARMKGCFASFDIKERVYRKPFGTSFLQGGQ
jgi:two-component system CheB/CheR fusion protein